MLLFVSVIQTGARHWTRMPMEPVSDLCPYRPTPGSSFTVELFHHLDRGSQYASEPYRHLLAEHGLVGSMGRRGNPYDNAKAESFMKTLKVEAVYLMDYETFEDVTAAAPSKD